MNSITEETMRHFKFSIPIPMRWNDMDALGHVNNIYYFEYFQIARGEYMPRISQMWDWKQHMFVIAHIQCDFIKELTLNSNKPTVRLRTISISNKSFEMEYLITSKASDGTDIIHAKGKSINVMVDMKEKRSIQLPNWLEKDLRNYDSI